jgi:hypothetical protein
MKICQPHWDRLREAIKARGLDHLGAKNGREAIAAVVTDLEGRGVENEYDPLMACNWMIMSQGLNVCGLAVMATDEAGNQPCPICMSVKMYEDSWIYGPVGEAWKEAVAKGLVPGEMEDGASSNMDAGSGG